MMMTWFFAQFLTLATDARVEVVRCSDGLSAALQAAIATTEPVTITCTAQTLFVAAGGRHVTVAREGTQDTLVAKVASAAAVLSSESPVAVDEIAASAQAPEQAPEQSLERRTELWIQPLGTPILALVGFAYGSVGVTTDIARHWQLVSSVGFLAGQMDHGEESTTSYGFQLWFSVAPVRFWQIGHGAPRTGFFLGPKLTVSVAHANRFLVEYLSPAVVAPAQTSFAIEVGYEAGFRFQLGHFDLSVTLPSVSLGYAHNRYATATLFPGQFGQDKDSLGFDTDLNLLRLGVDF